MNRRCIYLRGKFKSSKAQTFSHFSPFISHNSKQNNHTHYNMYMHTQKVKNIVMGRVLLLPKNRVFECSEFCQDEAKWNIFLPIRLLYPKFGYPMPSLYRKNCSHLLIEFLRPSSVQWLLATITTIGGMPFSSGICPEPGGEPKIIQLGCFPVRSSIVTRVGKYASFAIFFDGLNFKVLEYVESTAGNQLREKWKCN